MTCIHNGVLLSHKKNEIVTFAGKWMEVKTIMLSKISQSQKVKGHMFSSYVEDRKNEKKVGVDLMNIKERSVEERIQEIGGWEGGGSAGSDIGQIILLYSVHVRIW